MKARWLVGCSAIVVAGCSAITSFSGLASDDADAGSPTSDASTADGASANDANASPVDTGTDGPPAVCNPAQTITESFTSTMGAFSPYSTAPNYPNVESFYGDNVLVLFPFRDTTLVDAGPDADPVPKQYEFASAHSGVWLKTPVPLTSFDVTYDAQIRCTSGGSCADGLIFAWLDTQSPSVLMNKNIGCSAGLPDLIGGGAVNLDNYKNDPDETADPYAPSFQVMQLDPSKDAGTYPWQRAIEPLAFANAWHTITIKQRNGAVTVTFDGGKTLTTTVSVVKTGLVGFTAGVGGESDSVGIRNFTATFYDCVAK